MVLHFNNKPLLKERTMSKITLTPEAGYVHHLKINPDQKLDWENFRKSNGTVGIGVGWNRMDKSFYLPVSPLIEARYQLTQGAATEGHHAGFLRAGLYVGNVLALRTTVDIGFGYGGSSENKAHLYFSPNLSVGAFDTVYLGVSYRNYDIGSVHGIAVMLNVDLFGFFAFGGLGGLFEYDWSW